MIRSLRHDGFTLVEVMIALVIAASALLLLLQSNNVSAQKCVRACSHEALLHAAESKLDEVLCGSETATSGNIDGLPGSQWHASFSASIVGEVNDLKQVELEVSAGDGLAPVKLTSLLYAPKKGATR